MRKELINAMIRNGELRIRQRDTEKIKSIIKSSETNASVAKSVPLNDDSATLVFREVYESIRQLGDAKWWSTGYEPLNHVVSLEILKEIDIKEKLKLNFLDRFRKIRNDASYRGLRVSVSQAKEIIDFWDKCGKEVVSILSKDLK